MTTYTYTLDGLEYVTVPCGAPGAHVLQVVNTGSSVLHFTNRPVSDASDIYRDVIAGNSCSIYPANSGQGASAANLNVMANANGTYILAIGATKGAGSVSVTIIG